MNDIENIYEVLVCIDQINGTLEFFDNNKKNWNCSQKSLQLPTRQFLYETQLLDNSNLLFAIGGRNFDNSPTNTMFSCNLNDPSSQWTLKPSMSEKRNNFSSVTFNDTIYVLGGNHYKGQILSSCECYNNKLDKWSLIGSMNIARRNASVAIYNNNIYIAGGINENGTAEKSVEKYDFQFKTWSLVKPMATARSHFSLTLFAGRLWAIGGLGPKCALSSVESYDFKSKKWRMEESLSICRIGHSSIEFDHKLYVVGGFKKIFKNVVGSYVASPAQIIEKYASGKGWSENAVLEKVHPFAKLIIAFNIHIKQFITKFTQNSQKINKFDQITNSSDNLNQTNKVITVKFQNESSKVAVEVFQPQFIKLSNSAAVKKQTSFLIENNDDLDQQKLFVDAVSLPATVNDLVKKKSKHLLVCIDCKNAQKIKFYDLYHNSWKSSPISLQLPNRQNFQLALFNSMLYVFGGIDNAYNYINSVWRRNINDLSSEWTVKADIKQSRMWSSSVVNVLDATIYVCGGRDKSRRTLFSCERYDSQLNLWSKVADMNSDRAVASATILNGFIYIAGGIGKNGVLKSVERYCCQTDIWSHVTPMTTARAYFALTPFAGRLWAIGGVDGSYLHLCSCESYDPVTNTWKNEAPIKGERRNHAAIEFNGELYVVGGEGNNEHTNVVQKYAPTIGWKEDSILRNKINPKLLIIPFAYSSFFQPDSKKY